MVQDISPVLLLLAGYAVIGASVLVGIIMRPLEDPKAIDTYKILSSIIIFLIIWPIILCVSIADELANLGKLRDPPR